MDNSMTTEVTTLPAAITAPEAEPSSLSGLPLVEATWAELGFKVKPIGKRIFVRTDTAPKKIGSIYMPPEAWGMYGRRLGSQVFITATILSIGPRVQTDIAVGQKLIFNRLPFGWTFKMADGTFVGWVDVDEVFAVTESGEVMPFLQQ